MVFSEILLLVIAFIPKRSDIEYEQIKNFPSNFCCRSTAFDHCTLHLKLRLKISFLKAFFGIRVFHRRNVVALQRSSDAKFYQKCKLQAYRNETVTDISSSTNYVL